MQFSAVRNDASLVLSDVIALDGNFGFETYMFSGFTDLVAVTWTQLPGYHQFDNIVISDGGGGPTVHLPAPGARAACQFPSKR